MQQVVCKYMPSAAHDGAAAGLIFSRCVHTRPRLKALAACAGRPTIVENPAPAWRRPQVVSKRGAGRSCVPRGVARCGIKTGRHLPTWRQGVVRCGVKTWRHLFMSHQGARWRLQMWRQSMASFVYVASGSQVASPDVASKRGVTCLCGVREPGGVAKCGVRRWCHLLMSGGVAGAVPGFTPLATEFVVETWRHLLTWRQRATWRRRTWRQNVASGAIDLRRTWRQYLNQRPRLPGTFLQNVSSVVGRYVHPHRRPPCRINCGSQPSAPNSLKSDSQGVAPHEGEGA